MLIPASLLAVASHWPLDDLNVGEVAKIYHGTGKGWCNKLTTAFRILVGLAIAYIFWLDPILLICGLLAWLPLDHEWILNLRGRHGYGLHEKYMWPKWLHGEWGLVIWGVILILLVIGGLKWAT